MLLHLRQLGQKRLPCWIHSSDDALRLPALAPAPPSQVSPETTWLL